MEISQSSLKRDVWVQGPGSYLALYSLEMDIFGVATSAIRNFILGTHIAIRKS